MSESKKQLTDLLMQSGFAGSAQIVDMVQKVIWDELRSEYQILVDAWTLNHTFDADDALTLFDQAVRNMRGGR